ncbi:MAG: hypothetical protein ABIP89_01470 [Polyangiaceae bacterium]
MRPFFRLITLAGGLLAFAACATGMDPDAAGGDTPVDQDSGSSGSSGDSGGSSHAKDAGHTGDGGSLGTDAGASAGDGGALHDASVSTFDSSLPPTNACGLCDRHWVCNGFDDLWSSVGGKCVDQGNGTALRCDGTLDGASALNVGTWEGNASSFAMYFDNIGGGTVTIDCVPP